MARNTYGQAKKDFKHLESVVPLNDWVEIMGEIESFMETPTRAFALNLYDSCIGLWFHENRHETHSKRVEAIGDRWGKI